MNFRKSCAVGLLLGFMIFFSSVTFFFFAPNPANLVPNETRKTALVKTLSSRQTNDGSFTDVYHTFQALETLVILNSLNNVNAEKAADYLVSMQNRTSGGFPDSYLIYGELYVPMRVVNALQLVRGFDGLDRSLIDFVMRRYNETDGAFHEPTFELLGQQVAECHFPIMWYGPGDHAAYGKSNMISTFLAVDILKNLNALDKINVTRTVDWILSCRASNGGFGPFQQPHGEPYYPFLSDNPFFVDSQGAAIAFTYAAIGALNDLNSLESLTQSELDQAKSYVLSSQDQTGYFEPNKDAVNTRWSSNEIFHTYYAVSTLNYLNAINQTQQQMTKMQQWLLTRQLLKNWDANYGLFGNFFDDTHDAVLSLNASGGLYLLDELTPRALEQRTLILEISAALGGASFAIVLVIPYLIKWARKPKQTNNSEPPQNPISLQ